MARPRVVHAKPVSSFNSDWLRPTIEQYLEFVPWDPNKTYDKNTLFYLNCLDFPQHNNVLPAPVDHLVNQGFRVFIDNLWEIDPGPVPNTLRLCCAEWFWINESLWYQHLALDQYQPQPNPQYLALMPMNIERPHRTEFAAQLGTLKDKMIWSYVAQGRQLPRDGDMTDWNTQRRFDADWYNHSCISMVVETLVRPGSQYTPVFITEKTTKPLAFQHPFLVYGNANTLSTLRSWGFETFDNLWDESYDSMLEHQDRSTAITQILSQLEIQPRDAETQRRLHHNRDHFFNRELVLNKILHSVVYPILNYAESH